MISVVMLNWRRPRQTIENISGYANHPLVERILCFNNGASLRENQLPEKCVLIESSKDLGLYTRFAAGCLARTAAVFHTDDDLFIPANSLTRLYDAWKQAPLSCHGLFGRDVQHGYTGAAALGRVEVVLTRAVLCSRAVNNRALENSAAFDDLRGRPDGNGEDIILSFAAMELAGELNFAHKLPYAEHPECLNEQAGPDAVSIHLRWPDHRAHRTAVVERARSLLRARRKPDRVSHTGKNIIA